jgi:hypothetical protein
LGEPVLWCQSSDTKGEDITKNVNKKNTKKLYPFPQALLQLITNTPIYIDFITFIPTLWLRAAYLKYRR